MKQRGNQISALIQSFQSGQVEKALNASINSDNSAIQEQERWLESLEAKTQQFKASFQTLSNTIVSSDLLKFFVDLGIVGVDSLDTLFTHVSPLTVAFGGLFAFLGRDKLKQRFCPSWR